MERTLRAVSHTMALAVLLGTIAGTAFTQTPSDSLGWRLHSTEHFTFIYRSAHRTAVDELSSFADDVYAEVTGFFGSDPGHVPVVVYGETDLANGYYSPAPPQHIGLYVAQPSLPWIGARTESWLRLLLVHELTHYVQANYDRGLFSLLGTAFGRSLSGFFIAFAPIWTTEGLAVNTETIYTAGGRGRDPFFEMHYVAPVLDDRIFNLRQAGYDSHLAPRGRYYVAGYFIWEFLLDEYGAEVLQEVFDDFARFPLFGIWGAIHRATGDRMRHIYPRIVAELERRYADRTSADSAPRITPRTRSDYHLPAATAQGLYLYRTRPDALPAVVRFDRDTGTEHPVLETRLTDHASWSTTADGRTIAFATIAVDNAHPDEPMISSDIYLHDVPAGRTRQLSTGGGYHQPAIAPDGSFLVAIQRTGSYHRLVRFHLPAPKTALQGTGNTVRVLMEPDEARLYTPAISPDGSRVALVMNQRGDQQIVLLDARNGSVSLLAQLEEGTPYYPTFATDDLLLYGNDRGGRLALYGHNLATNEITLLVDDRIGAFAGRIVDGELIFASYTSDGYALRAERLERIRASQREGEPFPTVPGRPVASRVAPQAVEGERYVPWPRPVFWLPTAGVAGPGLEASGLGGGAMVYGADYLGRNTWQASAVYFPALSQIDYAIAWQTRYGPFTFQAASDAQYRVYDVTPDDPDEERAHIRTARQGVALTYQLRSDYRLGINRRSSIGLSANHILTLVSRTPFAVAGSVAAEADPRRSRIALATTFSADATPLSSRRAYHAPWARSFTATAATPLDAPGFAPQALLVLAGAGLNVGLGRSDHVVSVIPQASFASTVGYVSPYGLRGFETRTDHTPTEDLRGRYRLAIDYHTPHLLVDIPLLPSVGITAFGLTLFAESTGGYDAAPLRAGFDPAVALGTELTAVVNFWADIPVRLGVAVRLRPDDLHSFSLLDDSTVYLRSSFLQTIPQIPRYFDDQW